MKGTYVNKDFIIYLRLFILQIFINEFAIILNEVYEMKHKKFGYVRVSSKD